MDGETVQACPAPGYPPAMTSIVDSASSRDGTRLLTRHWVAGATGSDGPLTRHWPAEAPRAGVLIVHGVGEHSGRYEEVGEQFAAAGLETFGWDLRGMGASRGERAWTDRFDRFHDDVEDRLAATRAALPGRPVILYGHSLGGLISLGYALSDRPKPDLLVLSAPGIDDDLAAWKHKLAPILARILPKVRIANGIAPSMLSRDEGRQEAARTDPLMLNSSTTRLGALSFAEQARVRSAAATLAVPTLVIHGLDDPIVPARATEPLAEISGVTRRTYAGVRHELHNEPEGPAIIADVIAWIDSQLAGR
ncbi:MAG: alpha/beta hydrolase [Chloroflexota bacterium]|nr:MAG: alpha/beta hydrolase [Chloroflexota bacterium]